MTVSTSYAPLRYAGNGATTAFSVTWPFFSGSLRVTLVDANGVATQKTIGTHYTVSGGTDGDGLPATGTVTMLTAPASGETLYIERLSASTQAATWNANDAFPQEVVEAALDKLTLLTQEPQSRAFVDLAEAAAPPTPPSGHGRLYVKTDGKLYHKDDAGTETPITDASEAVATATAAAAAAAQDAQDAAAAATSASGWASTAATAATTATSAATDATTAAAAVGAATAAWQWNLDTSTSMADPGTGEVRFNHATWASVTAIAISDLAADTGNPDVSAVVLTWDASTNSAHRGLLTFRKKTAPSQYVSFAISGASTDNSGWTQIAVTHVGGSPTWSAADPLLATFQRTGNAGAAGSGSGDLLAANNLSDLANAATARSNLGLGALATLGTVGTSQISNDAVTYAKIQNVSATDRLLGRSSSGAGDVEEIVCTAAGRALLDDADAAAQLTTLGAASASDLTSGLAGKADISHAHAASDIISGTIATARLGSGTANSSSYLRGDQTWAAVSAGNANVNDQTSSSSTTYPIGTLVLCTTGGAHTLNSTATVSISGSAFNTTGSGSALTGTWRCCGNRALTGDNIAVFQRVA